MCVDTIALPKMSSKGSDKIAQSLEQGNVKFGVSSAEYQSNFRDRVFASDLQTRIAFAGSQYNRKHFLSLREMEHNVQERTRTSAKKLKCAMIFMLKTGTRW